jgi:hypothetical protein
MSTLHLVPADIRELYDVHEWRNAAGVLSTACPGEWADIIDVLRSFRLRRSYLTVPGGNRGPIAIAIDGGLMAKGWKARTFKTQIKVGEQTFDSPTHEVDCFKGNVALEVEWNNKDPFFDRDLNNFRLLFELRAIYAGVIVTRSDDLDPVIRELGRYPSFGQATTHMGKLVPRLEGGGGGGCPVLAFGISRRLLTED